MKRGIVMTAAALGVLALGGGALSYAASLPQKTDHATFDGSNPLNTKSGALCKTRGTHTDSAPWEMFMAVSNNSDTVQNFQVWNTGGDFVRYYVPAKSTVGITYAGGNTSGSQAFRLLTVPGSASELSGYVSAAGIQRSNGLTQNVECLSCDEDADGPAACQAIVPVP